MPRTRSARSKSATRKSPATKKKTTSKKKKAAASKSSDAGLLTPDNALLVNLGVMGMYGFSFYGVLGQTAHEKFFGAEEEGQGPLCKSLPNWMGTMNMLFCANLVAAYLHGNEQDKRRLLLVRAIQWGMWFACMSFIGAKSNGGSFVDNEYFMGMAAIFITGTISRHAAGVVTTSDPKPKLDTPADKAFLIFNIIALINIFNVMVQGGGDFFQGETKTAECSVDIKFFGSFIWAFLMDQTIVGQGASDAYKKAFLRAMVAFQPVFLYLNYVNSEHYPANMRMLQNAITIGQAAVAVWAERSL